ncbi:right-handed parallel beta-helix repeat-containing protein [Rossellomorea vietnamensis]|uniref:right-handed parallel beta-helix repeat-containing protein n=1 Tax=Rossellomorea vietnamensis TaxID=218284 RepID=UPI001E5C5918|nr:NosD domain-containing protein [Rossellomorea vietnamensis]MCC5803598.1 right-handed parallel beta-helix repeat-containing protein [Rossellomorea vietnamensis]
MKRWFIFMAGLWLMFVIDPTASYAKATLQKKIDLAKPGSTVTIDAGVYEEDLLISKPLTLKGKGNVQLKSGSGKPVITVENTEDVSIQNVELIGRKGDSVGIELKKGKDVSINKVNLLHFNQGIELFDIEDSEISDVTIKGKDGHFSKKANGITLYNTKNIKVTGSHIQQVQDGIYVEEDEQSKLTGNRISGSRYGIHLMYSEGTRVEDNRLHHNVTGLMHMESNGTTIKRNIMEQQTAYNGFGILLYNGKHIDVEENTFGHNGVGIALQNIEDSNVKSNIIESNQTGIQFIQYATSNVFSGNEVYANIQSVSSDLMGAVLERNYWDDYSGMDLDGDGLGDTSYQSNDSFAKLMVKQKAYQYFFESPAVVTLGRMEKKLSFQDKQSVRDESPLLQGSERKRDWGLDPVLLTLGLAGIVGGWYIWRRLNNPGV